MSFIKKFGILAIGIFLNCTSNQVCAQHTRALDSLEVHTLFNKRILGYSSHLLEKDRYNFNRLYMVYDSSKITLVDAAVANFNPGDTMPPIVNKSIGLATIDQRPKAFKFWFTRDKNFIYINYLKKGVPVKSNQFCLQEGIKTEPIDIFEICGEYLDGESRAYFKGYDDSSVVFMNRSLKCLVFEETFLPISSTGPVRKRMMYLEQFTLIPVRMLETYKYDNPKRTSTVRYQLNFLLNDSQIIRDPRPLCN